MGRSFKPETRREMGSNTPLPGLAYAVSPPAVYARSEKPGGGPLEEENSKPGTTEWQLQYVRFDDPVTMGPHIL